MLSPILSTLDARVLGLLSASLLVLLYAYSEHRSGLRKIPGPWLARISILFRFRLVWKGDAPLQYRRVHQQYGPIVRVGPKHVSIADPAMIPLIYGLGKNFTKTPFYTTMSLNYQGRRMDSMFTERDSQAHKALKSPVAQLFSMTNMRNFEVYADECTGIFMDAMRDLEGQAVDFAEWLQWYAFDVIGSITFQRRFGFMEKREDVDGMIGKINDGLEYVKLLGQVESLVRGFEFASRWKWLRRRLVPDTMERFLQITEHEVRKYDDSERRTARTDFLSQLRAKKEQSGKISPRDMVNHLSNNLLAGSDTTAIALRAIIYFIIRDARIHSKVVEEIQEADRLGKLSKAITFEECLNLTYLQAVIKEAMRVHPSVGFPLERYVPTGGAELCGYHLPAGTNVSISAPVVHMDRNIYGSDADDFRPERWLEASPEQLKLMDRSFLAFGHGSRTCIGKNISIMEMGKFVPQIFRHFEIELAEEDSEWHVHAAWFWKQSDLRVRLRARSNM
ncbi:cytochrome P450 [Aaosphaeria arxii CBS 175.79]|uniref:Cytochrome P450 n=1 Tax=Aaosphaeria arxii CBS 175.79 TaxID=1450172 RepID=A0A6A5Y0U4_9PLEO|nr:cytochrome P450 [Aaosphaeria arxii CBS 175.79]KAF2018869.1 cytochrome P450 [Aaosphaeria arxii CBS 175.79]